MFVLKRADIFIPFDLARKPELNGVLFEKYNHTKITPERPSNIYQTLNRL